jgi:hypothetical protein
LPHHYIAAMIDITRGHTRFRPMMLLISLPRFPMIQSATRSAHRMKSVLRRKHRVICAVTAHFTAGKHTRPQDTADDERAAPLRILLSDADISDCRRCRARIRRE